MIEELEQEIPPEADLEVEIDPKAEAEPKVAAKDADPVSDAVAVLRKQVEDETRRREAAETRAREASEFAQRAETDIRVREKEATERSLKASEETLKQLKAERRAALDAADYERESELNDKLILAAIEHRELQRAKPEPRPARATADPVDQWIEQSSPRTADYLRKHREEIRDTKVQNKLTSAHYAALSEGHVVDTDAYFDFVDNNVFKAKEKPAEPAKARREATPSAPVSRGGAPTSRSEGPTRVKLTSGEVSAAKAMGISTAEYAKRKHLMSQPGWNGPKFDTSYMN